LQLNSLLIDYTTGAALCIKRKKGYEQQIEALHAQQMNLETIQMVRNNTQLVFVIILTRFA